MLSLKRVNKAYKANRIQREARETMVCGKQREVPVREHNVLPDELTVSAIFNMRPLDPNLKVVDYAFSV